MKCCVSDAVTRRHACASTPDGVWNMLLEKGVRELQRWLSEYLAKSEEVVQWENRLLGYIGYLGWWGASVNTTRQHCQHIFAMKTKHKKIGQGDVLEGMRRIWILAGGLDRRNTDRKPRRLGDAEVVGRTLD